jgi:hypothetical protein
LMRQNTRSRFLYFLIKTAKESCRKCGVRQVLTLNSWRVISSGIWRRAVSWKSTDVSEEHVASIFTVEEWSKQETCKLLHSAISQKRELFINAAVGISNPNWVYEFSLYRQ